jgi:creatinine amidohydrolase
VKGCWLADLTWPEARARIDAGAVFVIPIGAAAKEHGHHLPLATDWILAQGITDRLLAELPMVAAPILGHGYYPAFRHYPGSQHLSPETFGAVIDEVLGGFADQGVRRMVVLNTGVSTTPVLTVRLREFYERRRIRVLAANIVALGRETDVLMRQRLGGHGDEHETSIILALAPDKVRMERAVEDYGHQERMPKSQLYVPTLFDGDPDSGWDYSASGVRGDPTGATAEKGEAMLHAIVRDVADGIRAHFPDAVA